MEINKTGGNDSQPSEGELTQVQKTAILWTVIAFALSILIIIEHTAPAIVAAGFFKKSFAVILGTICGLAGAMLGDAIRKFALPAGFFTTGGIGSILKTRIFWAIGPQAIGVLIGSFIGIGLVVM